MKNIIQISNKALGFVDSRRGCLSPDQYVSLILETVGDLTRTDDLVLNGANLLSVIEGGMAEKDLVEKYRGTYRLEDKITLLLKELGTVYPAGIPEAAFHDRCLEVGLTRDEVSLALQKFQEHTVVQSRAGARGNAIGKASEVLTRLRKLYQDRIPYDVFHKSCVQAGLSQPEINAIAIEHRLMIRKEINTDELYMKSLVVIIYDHLKSSFYQTLPRAEFYLKCLEHGMTPEEIQFAEEHRGGEFSADACFSALGRIASPLAQDKSAVVADLRKEYADSVPRAIFNMRCATSGFSEDDLRNIERIYAQCMIRDYNKNIASLGVQDTGAGVHGAGDVATRQLVGIIKVYGEPLSEDTFMDRCAAAGLDRDELRSAKKTYEQYARLKKVLDEIKFMNNKAYIILRYLLKIHPTGIPFKVFSQRCGAIGLKTDDVESAAMIACDLLTFGQGQDRYNLGLMDRIVQNYMKMTMGGMAMRDDLSGSQGSRPGDRQVGYIQRAGDPGHLMQDNLWDVANSPGEWR